ncbi:hypothetical protein ACJ5H2_13620 [Nocardioides sp. R1-1]|uniref:hypothetical protein n=1 Tax=Nocardioides sp. R1-1 TaxID=3383502 RepID=UPI0038CF8154
MSAAYRYLLCDLRTDRLIADLPLDGVTYERRISRPGPLQAKFSAASSQQIETARLVHQLAGRAALYVLRNNVAWWGGVLWNARPYQGPRGSVNLDLSGTTFDSYAHRRILRENKTYSQTDAGIIIPDLWRWLQSRPEGNIGVLAEDQPTGNLHDRTYLAADQSFIGKLIEDMGDLENGPEHTIDVSLDENGQRVKRLRVANRLGAETAQLVFHRTANGSGSITDWSSLADGTAGGTSFQTRGDAPNGNVGQQVDPALSQVVERTDLLEAGWPLLDHTEDRPGVTDAATLDGYANANAANLGGAPVTNSYTVTVGESGWNPNRIGEPVRIKLRDSWHVNTDVTVRPVGCRVTASQKGTHESIELIFGDE